MFRLISVVWILKVCIFDFVICCMLMVLVVIIVFIVFVSFGMLLVGLIS